MGTTRTPVVFIHGLWLHARSWNNWMEFFRGAGYEPIARFANAVSAEESADLYRRWTIPAPGRPLFQAAFANINPHAPSKVDTANTTRGPLLLIAGEKDHTVPPAITRATLKQYRRSPAVTELKEIPGRGHSLTIDTGWREVADTALAWLKGHGLQ